MPTMNIAARCVRALPGRLPTIREGKWVSSTLFPANSACVRPLSCPAQVGPSRHCGAALWDERLGARTVLVHVVAAVGDRPDDPEDQTDEWDDEEQRSGHRRPCRDGPFSPRGKGSTCTGGRAYATHRPAVGLVAAPGCRDLDSLSRGFDLSASHPPGSREHAARYLTRAWSVRLRRSSRTARPPACLPAGGRVHNAVMSGGGPASLQP
jgi:hypothetical protein